MNVIEFHRRNEKDWRALAGLVERIQRDGLGRLEPAEVVRLQRLYRKAAADLAKARTRGLADEPLRWLNELCARARAQVYRSPRRGLRDLARLVWRDLPGLLRARGALLGVVAGALFVGLLIGYLAVARDPSLGRLFASGERRLDPLGLGALGLQALLGGLLFGVGSPVVLVLAGASLGSLLALHPDPLALLFGAAAPGPLALGAALLSAAVGLEVGWAFTVPGSRPRREALAAAVGVGGRLLALAGALLVWSLLIELVVADRAPALQLATGGGTLVLLAGYPACGRRKCTRG